MARRLKRQIGAVSLERAMTRPPLRISRTITYRIDRRDPDWREVARFDDMAAAIRYAHNLATKRNPTRIVSEHMLADFTRKNGEVAVEWHAAIVKRHPEGDW